VPPDSAEIDLLQRAYATALSAAAPEQLLPPLLATMQPHGPAIVLGAGKAAAAMAATFHAHWQASVRGMVVTRYGHGLKPGESSGDIEIVEAGHPSPDSASLAAGARLLDLARNHDRGERLYCLVSGGGSSLAAAPLDRISFEAKRDAASYLMHAGADIREINCVRKHLSGLKGGRLAAAAHPAPVTTIAISDVPGDEVGDIASGPTIPDRTTQADAVRILRKFEYPALDQLLAVLEDPRYESPKPEDPGFAGDSVQLIATAATALEAAIGFLKHEGYKVLYLGDDLDQEAEFLGREHAELAREQVHAGQRVAIVSGGETRVVLSRTGGRGGRNLTYLAGLALGLAGEAGVWALAADTDGIDGHGDHAGGIVTPSLVALGESRGVSLAAKLAEHDTYAFFDTCSMLVKTGPTRTNVNDFRLILCHP
jgi:hydroxypyruvate reductase